MNFKKSIVILLRKLKNLITKILKTKIIYLKRHHKLKLKLIIIMMIPLNNLKMNRILLQLNQIYNKKLILMLEVKFFNYCFRLKLFQTK
jgi:hypothetical protein